VRIGVSADTPLSEVIKPAYYRQAVKGPIKKAGHIYLGRLYSIQVRNIGTTKLEKAKLKELKYHRHNNDVALNDL
jgi:hypothetical protein